jgi:hypothetical protein
LRKDVSEGVSAKNLLGPLGTSLATTHEENQAALGGRTTAQTVNIPGVGQIVVPGTEQKQNSQAIAKLIATTIAKLKAAIARRDRLVRERNQLAKRRGRVPGRAAIINRLNAQIKQLNALIKELKDDLGSLYQAWGEATTEEQAEKAANETEGDQGSSPDSGGADTGARERRRARPTSRRDCGQRSQRPRSRATSAARSERSARRSLCSSRGYRARQARTQSRCRDRSSTSAGRSRRSRHRSR